MWKLLAVVGALMAVSCGGTSASCKCAAGQVCAFESGVSKCAVPCGDDAGACSAGQSCLCASPCAGCGGCLPICK